MAWIGLLDASNGTSKSDSVVFEDEVERCWPSERLEALERERQIQDFAKSRGWNASIHNSEGLIRAIFLPF